MSKHNDTVEDIVREMISSHEGMIAFEFMSYADRFSAAHGREVAELRRHLKVAEDAMVKLQDRLVSSVHDGTIDPREALEIAESALAAIREEGDAR